jgi:1-phosphofructokinase family hexose kinase
MLVAGANLALDRVARTDTLRPGEVQHFRSVEARPGGKGVNVCRAARILGQPATLFVLAPGETGRAVVKLLRAEGIALHALDCPGEVRVASIILEDSGRVTVLNEPGPPLDAATWRSFESAVASALEPEQVFVLTGSLPPGAPLDAYVRLVERARGRAKTVIVDSTGDLLAAALAARPDLVTPNLDEAASVVGRGLRPLEAARRLVELGARNAAVTAGEHGVALAGEAGEAEIQAPRVVVVNPIGAGDCLVAAVALRLERGEPLRAALEYGVAVAAASVEHAIPGVLERLP